MRECEMATNHNGDASSETWMRHMRRGQFEQAWRVSDQVLKRRGGKVNWELPRHLQNIWNGSSLKDKRALVRCYHGLGDTIQFIRYAPLLKRFAAEVIVWAQPPLVPLLKKMRGIDRLLPLHDGAPRIDFDADVELMELPHVFRTTLAMIPASVPYLAVKPVKLKRTGNISVGLVWRAGDWDERRSIPFPLLAPLAEIANVDFFILQAGARAAGWNNQFGVEVGDLPLVKFARVVRALDLVITVDSMPAHLAGALGVPVWTLLQAHADWRWMENREDSPWYPTMRLFRQSRQGEWQPVIARVANELQALPARCDSLPPKRCQRNARKFHAHASVSCDATAVPVGRDGTKLTCICFV